MKLRFGWQLKSYSSFNVTRSRPKKGDLSQATIDLITEKNKYDVAVYEHAARLFESAVNKNQAEVSRIARAANRSRPIAGFLEATLFRPCRSSEGDQPRLFGNLRHCATADSADPGCAA
jgi:hypothetical protein